MRKRLDTVLKTVTQAQLAADMGISQPRISQLAKYNPKAWVEFDHLGFPVQISYQLTKIIRGVSDESNV